MKKKGIRIIAAIVIVLGLCLIVYNQIISNEEEYMPTDDEIALHLQLDTKEDVGLLVYDYRAGSHEYSGGISNANGSLIKHDSDNIVILNKEDLNNIENTQMTSQNIWSLFHGKPTLANHILLLSPVIRSMDIKPY